VTSPTKDAVLISNRLSLSAIKIFPVRRNSSGERTRGGHASGFLWEFQGDIYLITNWHNVCVWDPLLDKSLSEYGFTPNCIELTIELRQDVGDGRIKRDFRDAVVDLFDSNNQPQWLEHPTHGRRVDVIALKIAKLGTAVLNNPPLNSYKDFVDFDVTVGDDAFILGYPLGLDGGPKLPIWKRGSIASEPHYDLEGLPKILVDTATRQGMSGAPAIAVRRGLVMPRGAKGLGESIIGTAEAFLGVYSGRVGDDALGAQLGVIWKASVVSEIVSDGVRGSSPFQ
jgi:trypsin-like peptidase